MKYVYSVLAVTTFVVGAILVSWSIVATILLWVGSGILVGLAFYEDSKEFEQRMLKKLDAQLRAASSGSPRRVNRVRRIRIGTYMEAPVYNYYDDDDMDITDLVVAGLIIYKLMFEEMEDGSLVGEDMDGKPVLMPDSTRELHMDVESSVESLPVEESMIVSTEVVADKSAPEPSASQSEDSYSTGYEESEKYSSGDSDYGSSSSYDSGGSSDFGGGDFDD